MRRYAWILLACVLTGCSSAAWSVDELTHMPLNAGPREVYAASGDSLAAAAQKVFRDQGLDLAVDSAVGSSRELIGERPKALVRGSRSGRVVISPFDSLEEVRIVSPGQTADMFLAIDQALPLTASDLLVGNRVGLRLAGSNRFVTGTLLLPPDSTGRMQVGRGDRVLHLNRSQVSHLYVSRGSRGYWLAGSLMGAAVGALVGLAGTPSDQNSFGPDPRPYGALGGSLVGALVGGIIGKSIRSEVWSEVR